MTGNTALSLLGTKKITNIDLRKKVLVYVSSDDDTNSGPDTDTDDNLIRTHKKSLRKKEDILTYNMCYLNACFLNKKFIIFNLK
jgi:hypothetical protein